jgi:DNA polymerase III subunit epsilon
MFAIIDIETCGGKFTFPHSRITEICILVHDGLQITEKFTTLINPECHITQYFTQLTGISNDMVRDAPTFAEVARKILELTEGNIFVAHNAAFDYNFIKAEFASMGYNFKRETLCTVRMSRKLVPGKASYSLGNLCAELGIPIYARHRAEGDAVATAKLFDLLLHLKNQSASFRTKGLSDLMARKIDKIKPYVLNKIPETCGVYYFYNKEGDVIYIGKSVNMRDRALSHFNSRESGSHQRLLNDMVNADVKETGSELAALLLESEEIKRYKPKYNRRSKTDVFTHSIDWYRNEKGIICFRICEEEEAEQSLQSFVSYGAARAALDEWIERNTLCLRYCHLTSDDAVCFNLQIKQCNGICANQEEIETYNKRASQIIEAYQPPVKNGLIIDKGRHADESTLIYIENGHYKGFGYIDNQSAFQSPEELLGNIQHKRYYPDADIIIRSWLKQKGRGVKWIKFEGN